MRVVVVGATGNVGTSLLSALGSDDAVDEIVGVARRLPPATYPKTTWRHGDVTSSDLVALFRGADVVVHLAWLIQPSHDLRTLVATNIRGSQRVFDAVAEANVPSLVYASSVGAYAEGPKDRAVDESWPTEGTPTSFYGRHKAEVERRIHAFEREHSHIRVVRLRPALIFKREAAEEIRRYFLGPLLPSPLVRRSLLPIVPAVPRMRFQVVHCDDVAQAYRLAVTGQARGAFNIAAEPVLDGEELRGALRARPVRVPSPAVRLSIDVTWRLHLQPTPPGWLDMGLRTPIMDTTRARTDLGWTPTRDARDTLLELLDGLSDRAGGDTPPLAPASGGPFRIRELLTGVGRKPF